MKKRNTKEIILIESLKLFAESGYDGVTVRDIAEKLCIRQSSLYKHYSSKKNIFDNIIQKMNQEYENIMEKFNVPQGDFEKSAEKYKHIEPERIKDIGKSMFLYWFKDDYASLFRKMMVIEQYKNSEVYELLQNYLLSGTINYLSDLFKEMVRQNIFKDEDPMFIAVEFYSPIILLLNLYDGKLDKEEEAVSILMKHFEQFNIRFGKDMIK